MSFEQFFARLRLQLGGHELPLARVLGDIPLWIRREKSAFIVAIELFRLWSNVHHKFLKSSIALLIQPAFLVVSSHLCSFPGWCRICQLGRNGAMQCGVHIYAQGGARCNPLSTKTSKNSVERAYIGNKERLMHTSMCWAVLPPPQKRTKNNGYIARCSKKAKKSTAPRIPMWSPTIVLTRP